MRSRESRRRKKLGLQTRTIRIAPKQVTKLIDPASHCDAQRVTRDGRLRMSDPASHCDAQRVTRDETRNSFNPDIARLTFGEAGSSDAAKRWYSTMRSREYRRRRKLGLKSRTVRINPKQVTKLIELGYLSFDSRGDVKAEGIAFAHRLEVRWLAPKSSRHDSTRRNLADFGDESRIDLRQVTDAKQRHVARNLGGE